MQFLSHSLSIGLGAALGANLRYWIGYLMTGKDSNGFPWHTLLINVTGSIALGVVMALALLKGWGTGWRVFAAVGICGGYTTFSTYSAETVRLFEDGHVAQGVSYVLASNLLSILGCLAGAHLVRMLIAPPAS